MEELVVVDQEPGASMHVKSSELQKEQVVAASYSDGQIQKLVDVISRSQHGYRELIDNLDQAVFTLSAEGEVRVANRYLAELLGVTFQNLIGHNLTEFLDAPTLAEAERRLPLLLKEDSWSGIIPVRLKKDGRSRYFHCWLQSDVEVGQPACVRGWARDVTAQHDSEIRFSELFQSLREGIFFSTPEGRILEANPALVKILGYRSKEELQSVSLREVYRDPSVRDSLIQDLDRDGSVQNREIILLRKDRKEVCCLASGFAIRDASGRMVQTQATIVDITERREIEKKLHKEQEFVHRLVDSFPDMVAVFDCDKRFTYVSDRTKDVLGVEPKEFIGQTLGWRSDPESRRELLEMLDSIISGRESQASLEFSTRHADGRMKTLRVNAAPLFDELGKINAVVASARDITEIKLAIESSSNSDKFAAMGQMLTGAAHELNNPLTAILGVSDLLRESAVDDISRRQANLIFQQGRRAAGIVQNLLAFSRPPSQGRPQINLDEVVRQALEGHQALLSQKNIAVTLDSPKNLPAVEGDSKLLIQAFTNIIANAEKAISDFRGSGNLRVSLAAAGNRVRVAFADDGPGIPSADMGKIFDPFFTTKRPGGSPGLGLTICLAIVKEHGGTIEVQSSAGSGSAFCILLPVASGMLPEAPEMSSAPAAIPLPGSQSLRGHSALIVDDEESIREIVEDGLAARGMEVATAGSAEAALAYLASHSPEVVICDFNLPGMTGEQLFEKVRNRAGVLPPRFVFITGELVTPDDDSRLKEWSASILQKPFQVSALAEHLAKILELKAVG
jgi:two-component system, NtrC family, sensor kinase